MKKLLLALLCITTISAAFPAFAGPDWQLIEQGRKAKQAQLAHADNKDHSSGMDGKMAHQMDPKMHEKMEQMMKDCQEMMSMMSMMKKS
jgi:enoyl-CoA hydratase/carnithine racemase